MSDENISFAKMAADLDSNPKIIRGGPNCREVYSFILRRVALRESQGRVPVSNLDPPYVARMLMRTVPEAEEGIRACLQPYKEERPLLEIQGGDVVVCGWDDEWARRPLTPTERKRNQRARDREAAPAQPECHAVTIGHDESRDVTHVTDQIRLEKIRSEAVCETAISVLPSAAHTPFDPSGWSPEPSDANTHATLEANVRGVVVEYALKKFRTWARKKNWNAWRCADEWPLWLLKEHPTAVSVREALVAGDRKKNARIAVDRTRQEIEARDRLAKADRAEVERIAHEFQTQKATG